MPPKKAQSTAGSHQSPAAGNVRKTLDSCGSNWHWTNERHVHFLNSMEASFVESMLCNGGSAAAAPPLDRYLPDSAESTQDFAKERRNRHHTASPSDIVGSGGRRADKKTRILACQKSSQDQVVPQLPYKNDDKDDDVTFGTTPFGDGNILDK